MNHSKKGITEMTDRSFSLSDFKSGIVRIDFRNYTVKELRHLRKICESINKYRDVPSYSFGSCYYCKNGRWYEGGRHQLSGDLCRATDIKIGES